MGFNCFLSCKKDVLNSTRDLFEFENKCVENCSKNLLKTDSDYYEVNESGVMKCSICPVCQEMKNGKCVMKENCSFIDGQVQYQSQTLVFDSTDIIISVSVVGGAIVLALIALIVVNITCHRKGFAKITDDVNYQKYWLLFILLFSYSKHPSRAALRAIRSTPPGALSPISRTDVFKSLRVMRFCSKNASIRLRITARIILFRITTGKRFTLLKIISISKTGAFPIVLFNQQIWII